MRLLILLLACSAPLLTGCSHLYNKSNDDTAKAAKADFDAGKLAERIKAQHAILLELEERDVAAFRKVTNANRDNDLLSLVMASEKKLADGTDESPSIETGFVTRFVRYTDARLLILRGLSTDPATQKAVSEATAEKVRAAGAQLAPRRNLNNTMLGLGNLPACGADLTKLKNANDAELLAKMVGEPLAKHARDLWPALKDQVRLLGAECENELAAGLVERDHAAPASLLGKAVVAHRDQVAKHAEAIANAVLAKSTMQTAAADLAAATKTLDVKERQNSFACPVIDQSDPKPTELPETRLCKALAQLDNMGGIGHEIVAEEKIARIGHILNALSGIDPPAIDGKSGDVDTALALVAASTRLGHALRKYQHADQWPALEPLIIEKQLAEAQLASAKARMALDQARLNYSEEQLAALRLEIALLDSAAAQAATGYGGLVKLRPVMDQLDKASAKAAAKAAQPAAAGIVVSGQLTEVVVWTKCTEKNSHLCKSYEDLLNTKWERVGTPPERHAFRAMALLSQSHSVARDRYQTASVRIALSRYQESLILSEEALASWVAILSTPIDLLRQYHEGGLKPETFAPFLQTIGIGAIALRVK